MAAGAAAKQQRDEIPESSRKAARKLEMKKKLFVGAAVGTAGLVALTGATFAHSDNDNPGHSVKDRVAEILGIEPEELQDAFQQAREEHRDEHIAERLANAVEEGIITQEEADSIQAWLDSMPEVLEGVGGPKTLGYFVKATASDERIEAIVERLLNAEKITEEDVEHVTGWLSSAPTEALQKLAQGDDSDRPRRGFRGQFRGEGPGGRLFEGRFQLRPYVPPVDDADSGESDGSATAVSVAITA